MRTPWRFVADLVSRKPKSDAIDEQASDIGEVKALAYTPVEEVLPEHVEVSESAPAAEADRLSEQAEIETTLETATEATPAVKTEAIAPTRADGPDEAVYPTASAASDDTDLVDEPETPVKTEAGLKRVRVTPVPLAKGEETHPPLSAESQTLPVAKTFHEEMCELDAEIALLRRELATKLIAQNAQLRKMLAKFGPH